MLEVTRLSKEYDSDSPSARVSVLSDFCLRVPTGAFAVLVGPSGCGKTSFFDILVGSVRADSGEISWKGRPVPDLRGLCAYMQQKDLLLPWLTLLENALLPRSVVGRVSAGDFNEARRLFERLGLAGFESFPPAAVSGGMRQRCALARTLMMSGECVLLDEPLSALDASTRRSLRRLLVLLQYEFGKTVLMITHDVEEALLLADDLYILGTRPMRIREHIRLDFPKPRSEACAEFVALRERILGALEPGAATEAP